MPKYGARTNVPLVLFPTAGAPTLPTAWSAASGGYAMNARGMGNAKWTGPTDFSKWSEAHGRLRHKAKKGDDEGVSLGGLAKNFGGDIGEFIGGIPGMVKLGWNVGSGLVGTVATGGRHEGSKKKLKGGADDVVQGLVQTGKQWGQVGLALGTAGQKGSLRPLYEDPLYMLLDGAVVASAGVGATVKGAAVANRAAKSAKASDSALARRLRASTRTRQLKDPVMDVPNVPGLPARTAPQARLAQEALGEVPNPSRGAVSAQTVGTLTPRRGPVPLSAPVQGPRRGQVDPDLPYRTHEAGINEVLAELARSGGNAGGTRRAGQILKDLAPDTPRSVIDKVILNTNWAGFKTPGGKTAALAAYSPFRLGAIQEVTDPGELGLYAQRLKERGKDADDPTSDIELGRVVVQQRRLSRGPARRAAQRTYRRTVVPFFDRHGGKLPTEATRKYSSSVYRGQRRAAKQATREITESVGTQLTKAGGRGAAWASARVVRDKEIQLIGSKMLEAVVTSNDPAVIRQQLRPLLETYRSQSKSELLRDNVPARQAQEARIKMIEELLDENHPLWSDKKRMQRLTDYVNYQRVMAKEIERRGLADPRFAQLDPEDLSTASWRNVYREAKTAPARLIRGSAAFSATAGPSGRVVDKDAYAELAGKGVSNVEDLFSDSKSNKRLIAVLQTRVNSRRTKKAEDSPEQRGSKEATGIRESVARASSNGSVDKGVMAAIIESLFTPSSQAHARASSAAKGGGAKVDPEALVNVIGRSSGGTLDDIAAARVVNAIAVQVSKEWKPSTEKGRLVHVATGQTARVEEVIAKTYIGGGKEKVSLRRLESGRDEAMQGELVYFSPTTNKYLPVREAIDPGSVRADVLKKLDDEDKRREFSKWFSSKQAAEVKDFWEKARKGQLGDGEYLVINAFNHADALQRIDIELAALGGKDASLGARNVRDMLTVAKLAMDKQFREKKEANLRIAQESQGPRAEMQTIEEVATNYLAEVTRPILVNSDRVHNHGHWDPYATAMDAGDKTFVDWERLTKQFDELRKNDSEGFRKLYEEFNSSKVLGAVDQMEDAIYVQHRLGYDDGAGVKNNYTQGGGGTQSANPGTRTYELFESGLEDVGVTALLRQLDITVRNAGQASLMGQVFATHALRDSAGKLLIFAGDHGSHASMIDNTKYAKVSMKDLTELQSWIERDAKVAGLKSNLTDDKPDAMPSLAQYLQDRGNVNGHRLVDDQDFVNRDGGYPESEQFIYVERAMWDEVWQLRENVKVDGWQKAMAKYDSFLGLWRRGILGLAPRWIINNLVGNTFFYGVATMGDFKSFRLASTGAIPRSDRFGVNAQRRQTEAGFGNDTPLSSAPKSDELWTDADIEARFNLRDAVARGERPNAAVGYATRENIAGEYSHGIEGTGYTTQGEMGRGGTGSRWGDEYTQSNDPIFYSGVEQSSRSIGAKRNSIVGAPSRAFNAATSRAQRINQNLEATFRRAMYIHFARKYLKEQGTTKELKGLAKEKQWDSQRTDYELLQAVQNIPDSAKREIMQDMRNWIGDYGNLNAFERQVMRRAIPFYSWLRVINTWAFGLPFRSPLRAEILATAANIAVEVQGDRSHLPWWERNRIELGGGLSLRTAGMNPLESIYESSQAILGEPDLTSKAGATLRWAAGSSTPPVQEIVKAISGVNTFGGQDLTAPPDRNGRITPYGRDPMYLNTVTGDLDSSKPFSSLGVTAENLMPGVSAIAPVVRDIVGAGRRPYDTVSTSELIANKIGLYGFTDENDYYQPPRDISKTSGRTPLAPGATRFLSLLGAPINRYDDELERTASSARVAEYLKGALPQNRLLHKQRLKRGIKRADFNYSR